MGNCQFKAADGVYWDISDILNSQIALKDTELGTDAATSFQLSATFDNSGSLRVNDRGYNDTVALQKLWSYLLNKEFDDNGAMSSFENSEYCKTNTCTKVEIVDSELNGIIQCWDADSGDIYGHGHCSSIASAGTLYLSEEFTISSDDAKNAEGSVCYYCKDNDNNDYYNAAKRKCESIGARLPNTAEALQLSEKNLIKSTYTWLSEETNASDAQILYEGRASSAPKYGEITTFYCVGN